MSYKIDFKWDDEAAVWIATSQDVPGLVLNESVGDCPQVTHDRLEV